MAEKPTKKELLKFAEKKGLVIPKKVTVKMLLELLDESKSGWDNWPYSSTPPASWPKKDKPEAPPEPEIPKALQQPSESKPAGKCETCKRPGGAISKCLQCGKAYCSRCREPYKGRYSNCQHCGASDY